MSSNLPAELGVNHPDIPFPLRLNANEDKVIRTDTGEVAVLVSPGFGAGFVTWNYDNKLTPYCPPAVIAVLLNKRELITSEALAEYYDDPNDDYYYSTHGAGDLIVQWLKPDTAFRIEEYDGNESLRTSDDLYYVA